MSKVFLDFGHGEHDSGAVGAIPTLPPEKDLVLHIGSELGTLLGSAGYDVAYSRTMDIFKTLSERSDLANTWGADYFISIHCNSAHNTNATGIETYHHPGSDAGKPLATAIQAEMIDEFSAHRDRGVKSANYSVLRRTRMPAALVEVEFISNAEMHHFVADNTMRIAIAISRGIKVVAPLVGPVIPAPASCRCPHCGNAVELTKA